MMQFELTPKRDLTFVTAPAHPQLTDAVLHTALFFNGISFGIRNAIGMVIGIGIMLLLLVLACITFPLFLLQLLLLTLILSCTVLPSLLQSHLFPHPLPPPPPHSVSSSSSFPSVSANTARTLDTFSADVSYDLCNAKSAIRPVGATSAMKH